ncbi:MAG: hypothetical protein K8S97_08525 [Anaerolineae bacterium]|nr:hypothetical protein [Anaerolineae bacterium]
MRKKHQIEKRDPDLRDKRIAELEAENAKMRAELATLNAWATGGVQGVQQLVQTVQQERDQLLQANQILATWHEHTLLYLKTVQTSAAKIANISKAVYEERLAGILAGEEWRKFMPILQELLHTSTEHTADMVAKMHDGIAEEISDSGETAITVHEITRHAQTTAVYDIAIRMMVLMWANSHAPEVVAAEILHQWEHGDPDPTLVTVLCEQWDGGPSANTLKTALDKVKGYRAIKHRKTQAGAARDLDLSERTLQRYIEIVASAERLASAPIDLAHAAVERLNARFVPDETRE